MQKKLFYLATTLSVGLLIGCGGGGGGSSDDIDNKTVYKLSPQTGTQSYLFYGNTNHKALGAIKNIR
jgi:hypothetical protein